MMSACFLYQFIMDSSSSNIKNGTTDQNPPVEGEMEEKRNVVPTEVVDMLSLTPILSDDTGKSNAMVSNLDQPVFAEPKSDERDEDTSKTKENPDVSFDSELNKEGLTEEDDNKTIQLSREFPEVLSDPESERMVEDEDILTLSKMLSSSAQ